MSLDIGVGLQNAMPLVVCFPRGKRSYYIWYKKKIIKVGYGTVLSCQQNSGIMNLRDADSSTSISSAYYTVGVQVFFMFYFTNESFTFSLFH